MCICPIMCLGNFKTMHSDYLLEMGPRTVLEGFYKYGLFAMKDESRLLTGKVEEGVE